MIVFKNDPVETMEETNTSLKAPYDIHKMDEIFQFSLIFLKPPPTSPRY